MNDTPNFEQLSERGRLRSLAVNRGSVFGSVFDHLSTWDNE